MDPLTHTATGLFLGRAGMKRWTPLATPILLLAANAPDCDIVTAAGGSLGYLQYHRHLTHSLVAAPVLALAVVVLVRLAARQPVRWLGAFAAALVAVSSHLALDLTNAYGVRLLLPFSSRWFEWDLTNIVDLWIWAVLLLAVTGPFLARLVGSEIASGTSKTRHHGRGFAIFALAFLLVYNYGRSVLHERAVAVAGSRIYHGRDPLRVAAVPNTAIPWRWRALIETEDFYAVAGVDLLRDFDPTQAAIFQKPEPQPALDAARRSVDIRGFLGFSQYPLWHVLPVAEPENARLVEVVDMRFGTPTDPGFAAGAVVGPSLNIVSEYLRIGRPRP